MIGFSGLCIQFFVWNENPSAEKHLRSIQFMSADTMTMLTSAGNVVSVRVSANGKSLDNLFLTSIQLINDGSTTIEPQDFIESPTISVNGNWQIVALVPENNGNKNAPKVEWKRKSDNEFEFTPTLLNPSDAINLTLYSTIVNKDKVSNEEKKNLPFQWRARIKNLRSVSYEDPFESSYTYHIYMGSAAYFGDSVVFMFIFSTLTIFCFVYLVYMNGYFQDFNFLTGTLLIILIALSILTSDAAVNIMFQSWGIFASTLIGWKPIYLITTAVGMGYLSWNARARSAARADRDSHTAPVE